jgi:hypothetical protein
MWLAIAAVAVVSLARIEAGGNATLNTNPVLALLAGQQNASSISAAGSPQVVRTRNGSGVFLHEGDSGAWMAMLPVLFVGLVVPLSLISSRSIVSLGRTPASPGLPQKFQRPPPALL